MSGALFSVAAGVGAQVLPSVGYPDMVLQMFVIFMNMCQTVLLAYIAQRWSQLPRPPDT